MSTSSAEKEPLQHEFSFGPGCVTVVATVGLVVVVTLFVRRLVHGRRYHSNATLHGKTAIVTGCNTGIGKETVRDFAKRGARVIMACRNLDSANQAVKDIRKQNPNADIVVMKLDLASFDSVREFAKEVLDTERHIDILVNNAGLMCLKSKTKDGFDMTFQTNHLGHFLLTNLLLDKIKKSAPARIITVSSWGHNLVNCMNWDDLNFDQPDSYTSLRVYGHSKLANILFTKELAKRLSGTGVTTYALHPGVIHTSFDRHVHNNMFLKTWFFCMRPFSRTIEEGALTTIYCAVDENLQNKSGCYYCDCHEAIPTPAALDAEAAEKLWNVSLKMVGLESPIFKKE